MYSHDVDTHYVEHKRYGRTPGRMSVDVESSSARFRDCAQDHGDLLAASSAPVVGQVRQERKVGAEK